MVTIPLFLFLPFCFPSHSSIFLSFFLLFFFCSSFFFPSSVRLVWADGLVVLFQVLLPVFFEDFWNDRTLRRCSIILHFHIFFYFDWVYLERRWKSRAKSPFGFLRRLQQMFWIRFDEISFGANDARSKCKKNSVSSFYFLSGVDSFWGKVMNISVVQPFQSGAFYSRRSLTFVLTPSSRLFVPTIDLRSARTSWSLLWWHRWCCCVASRVVAGPRSFSNYETKAKKTTTPTTMITRER